MTDLHQTLKSALMDYADALLNGDDPHPDVAAEALARRVPPVVTDGVVKAIEDNPCVGLQWDGDVRVAYCDVDALAEVLTDALPHAVTRDDVLEELAAEAERGCMTYETTEWDGSSWLADWLRSRKGGA